MNSALPCSVCSAPKAPHACGLCAAAVCKACVIYLDPEDFSFLSKTPPQLKHDKYCQRCFDDHVAPERARYDALMAQAKEIYFLTKNYPGYVRVMQRHTKRVRVPACDDRRETILRLAFFAAELGFNAIIEADVDSTKVRQGSGSKAGRGQYQTSTWHGSALPANIDGERMELSSLKGF